MFAPKMPPSVRESDQGVRQAQQQQREAAARDRRQHHGPAAEAVGDAPPDGREEGLHHGVAGEQRPEHGGARPVRLGQERQDRNHDAEADQVDHDDAEQHGERGAAAFGCHACGIVAAHPSSV
jgi:hypothetical protein